MQQATLCFPITDTHILLGYKKVGFGSGLYNGFGGKVKKKETIEEAALRELYEEASLNAFAEHLDKKGTIQFFFGGRPKFEVHIFTIHTWIGEPAESNEMKPKWHKRDALPYETMWPADREWIPLILEQSKKIEGKVFFDETGKTVEKFEWVEVTE